MKYEVSNHMINETLSQLALFELNSFSRLVRVQALQVFNKERLGVGLCVSNYLYHSRRSNQTKRFRLDDFQTVVVVVDWCRLELIDSAYLHTW